uniref:separase n=1 Tax=Cyanoderma ruficeps TaxID=181631 RepID=A0A8C3RJ80_9PASS
MLEGLEGLPEAERGKFLDVTAAVTFRLGQALQSQNVPEAAGAVCEPLCRAVLDRNGYGWTGVTTDRLHRCFRLQVESWRCRGRPRRALDTLGQWLLALGTHCQGLGTHSQHAQGLVAEPVALWARIKTEAAKQGEEELRLWTVRDALESQSRPRSRSLCGDTVLLLLLAELRAYKSLRGPTGPERYNVLCDLLELGDPQGELGDPNRSLPRAVALLELGQLLCSHSFAPHTDCSALDALQESLRLLESLSRNSQTWNSQMRDQLLDERAQAQLWLHICTLEGLMEKSISRERRGRLQGRDGTCCSLSPDTALSKPLDEAFSLWQQLLENPGIPKIRSPEQTLSSLQLLGALYRLQGKVRARRRREFGMKKRRGGNQAVSLVLQALQGPLRPTRGWFLLQARGLRVVAALLELPPALLPPALRDTLRGHGGDTGNPKLSHPSTPRVKSQRDSLPAGPQTPQTLPEFPVPDPKPRRAPQRRAKIQLHKGHPEKKKTLELHPNPAAEEEEEEEFLQGPSLDLLPPSALPEQPAALTASPELKPGKRKVLEFLDHPRGCCCSFCSDPALVALGLRWLLAQARLWVVAGEVTPGVTLLREVLARCDSAGTRLARQALQGHPAHGDTFGDSTPSPPGPLAELVASAYSTLALQSPPSLSQSVPIWDEELERGLTLLASQSPPAAGLGVAVATLLLTKALATLGHVATSLGLSVDDVLAQNWTPRPPPTPKKPPKNPKAPPKTAPQKAKPAKAKVGKTPKAKPPKFGDVFTLGDSDNEVPPIVLRPGGACTPHPKSGAPQKMLLGGSRTPFTIFSEEPSPPGGNSRLHRAPKIPGRVKSRIRVSLGMGEKVWGGKFGKGNFCGGESLGGILGRFHLSDPKIALFNPLSPLFQAGPTRKFQNLGTRGIPQIQRDAAPPPSPVSSRNLGDFGGILGEFWDFWGPAGHVLTSPGVFFPFPGISFFFFFSQEFPLLNFSLSPKLFFLPQNFSFPQNFPFLHPKLFPSCRDPSCPLCPLSGHCPLCPLSLLTTVPAVPQVSLPWTLTPLTTVPSHCPLCPSGVPSLASVQSLLREALAWVGHFPPGSLYGQLCQLLALTLGDRDPVATAGLLAESLSVTTRHQLLAIVHRKAAAAAGGGGDISDQLRGLSLQEGDSQNSQTPPDSQSHLAQLQELFQFSSAGLGPAERERFREQLQKIPHGVTVCQLSLAGASPAVVGDTLLLTRLERGAEPLSVRIATRHRQAPLSGILREFEEIQREQREANACTERRLWWERRAHLDQRMQRLIQSLDQDVLGCWRGLLLPRDPGNSPLDEQELSQLIQELRECGWDSPEPALLQTLLSVLCPADVHALAMALCPVRPLRARLLLDEALERLTQGSGSVLSRGVNPTNTFYVLNPQRDLGGTEERFRGWFHSEPGWQGVTGAAPTPQQLQEALGERDLYIYAGHGAGARLLEGQSLAHLQCRAVVLLFGCSSAALSPRGNLEPTGTVLKYILAGCPLVLGNLWDVTDRDLDRLTLALLRGWLGGGPGTPLLAQLAQARQAPRLKSLIGAAPVAYGLPVSLC